MRVALDATYSLDTQLTGVGFYSREMLFGLAARSPEWRFDFCYRPHRFLRSFRDDLPPNARRFFLHDRHWLPQRADVFHGLNQRLPERRLRRSVVTFHDLFVFTDEFSTPDFRRRFQQLSQEAARQADLIIAVSQFSADRIHDILKVERSRIRVVHHGVHPHTPKLISRQPVILCVGAVQTRKNIERLVEAFERLRTDWKLILGGSYGFGSDSILQRIEASPARSRILVTGYLSAESLEDWYARASIFAFPSLGEGFGIPILEAMSAGVPVLCSNASALPEVAGDAALMVEPQDVDQLQAGLQRLIDDADLREELIVKGGKRASHFTWEKAVDQTLAVYKELI